MCIHLLPLLSSSSSSTSWRGNDGRIKYWLWVNGILLLLAFLLVGSTRRWHFLNENQHAILIQNAFALCSTNCSFNKWTSTQLHSFGVKRAEQTHLLFVFMEIKFKFHVIRGEKNVLLINHASLVDGEIKCSVSPRKSFAINFKIKRKCRWKRYYRRKEEKEELLTCPNDLLTPCV